MTAQNSAAYMAAYDSTSGAPSEAPAAPAPSRFRRMLGPIEGGKVPKRTAYVAAQFPLGIVYFVFVADSSICLPAPPCPFEGRGGWGEWGDPRD